jgi:hypothetical protein
VHHGNRKMLILEMEGVRVCDLFGWLVADGWCWFVLREEYCGLVCSERKVLLADG